MLYERIFNITDVLLYEMIDEVLKTLIYIVNRWYLKYMATYDTYNTYDAHDTYGSLSIIRVN